MLMPRRRDSSAPATPLTPSKDSPSRSSSTRRLSKAEYVLEKEEMAEMKRREKEVASPLRWALIVSGGGQVLNEPGVYVPGIRVFKLWGTSMSTSAVVALNACLVLCAAPCRLR